MLPNITINQVTGGLGRKAANKDGILGLFVVGGVATADYALGDVTTFYSLNMAQNIGIDAAYDIANGVLVHYHLSEIYRINPSAKVWFMMIDAAVTLNVALDPAENYCRKLLKLAAGDIKCLGVSANGLSITSIVMAQSLVDSEFSEYRLVNVFLEGQNLPGATIATLPDLTTLNARDVSVVIGQDGKKSEDSGILNFANIGTILGSYSLNEVHECIGWPKENLQNSLTNEALQVFTDIRFSDNTPITDYSKSELDAIHGKGYTFVRAFAGLSGSFWVDDKTCIEESDDFSQVYLNRIIKKAIDIVYKYLVRYINSPLSVDSSGRLSDINKSVIKSDIESRINAEMSNNISGIGFIIVDPAFDENNTPYPSILTDNVLRVAIGIAPYGKATQIIANVGFFNPAFG